MEAPKNVSSIDKLTIQGKAGGLSPGGVDIDLGHSTGCFVLLGQMGMRLNRLGSWGKW